MPLLVDAGPIRVGENHRPFSFTWQDDSGTAIDLTGAALSLRFLDRAAGTARTGDGTITPIVLTLGQFQYKLSTTDVGVAGNFEVQVTATWFGTEKEISDRFLLPIEQPI